MSRFTMDQLTTVMSRPEDIRNFSIVAQVDAGKCFQKGTPIRLSDGSLKPVECLTTNDSVIGLDGKSKRIVEIHRGMGTLYKINQDLGDSYVVNGKHILVLKSANNQGYDVIEIGVEDYLRLSEETKKTLYGFKQREGTDCTIMKISVIEHGIGEYVGFEIEGDGRFLAPDFTAWHNSTLTDSLLSHAGLINKRDAGEKRQTDTMKQEQERGITIKSVGVTLCVTHEEKDRILNVVDSPGHVDFSAEVSAALRVTDGAIVLIDTVDGVKAQTRTVLVQALEERIKPVLVINKIDKLFLSLKLKPNEIYDQFVKNVQDVNQVIDTYQDPVMVAKTKDQKVDPVCGDVIFATAYHTWGFGLKTFAKIYAPMMKKSIPNMMKYLWKRENFCKLIIEPIYYMLNCCQSHPEKSEDGKSLIDLVSKLKININKTDYDLKGKELMRCIMGTWLPVAEAIIDLAIDHLPSPKEAQKYRAELLYSGPKDDIYYNSIRDCDPNGPLIVYISKMVPNKDNSHFYAFGRVFSGTATATKIKVLTNDHFPMKEYKGQEDQESSSSNSGVVHTVKGNTALSDNIQRVVLMMATRMEHVTKVPAGNTIALDGIDKTMIKSGTVVGEEHVACFPLKNMNFSVSPVVRYSIKPKKSSDIGKFTETIKKFVKSDPCLLYIFNKDSGEHILAGAGELHLEVALEQLRTDFLKNIEFDVSEPIVQYNETVIGESSLVCLAKSANKHNRIFMTAHALDEKFVTEMTKGDMPSDLKERIKFVGKTETKSGIDDPKKIWAFAPDQNPSNIFVNETSGTQYLNEVSGALYNGFLTNCEKGPLCEEPVQGVRFSLRDIKLHQDNVHRGDNQILPAMRNVIFSTMLTAQPRLLEPVFGVEVSLPRDKVSNLYTVMGRRRGKVNTITSESNGVMTNAEAHLPVAESFGFIEELRGETSGTAFASLFFSHWQVVPGDPLEEGSYANKIMLDVRKRKGRKVETPNVSDYLDKI